MHVLTAINFALLVLCVVLLRHRANESRNPKNAGYLVLIIPGMIIFSLGYCIAGLAYNEYTTLLWISYKWYVDLYLFPVLISVFLCILSARLGLNHCVNAVMALAFFLMVSYFCLLSYAIIDFSNGVMIGDIEYEECVEYGFEFYRQGRLDKAMEHFGIKRIPDKGNVSTDPYIGIALVHVKRGDMEEASRYFRVALERGATPETKYCDLLKGDAGYKKLMEDKVLKDLAEERDFCGFYKDGR